MKKTNDFEKNNVDEELENFFDLHGENESTPNASFKELENTIDDFSFKSEEEFDKELLSEGATAIIGIGKDCSYNEARDFTYYFYNSECEYEDEKSLFNFYFSSLLNFNNTLKVLNHKIDRCRKNNVSFDALENLLVETSDNRKDFYDNCWIYFEYIKRDIDEILKITKDVMIRSANNLYGNISSLDNLLTENEIVHPKMKLMFDAFIKGEENFEVLDFSDRNVINLLNNFIEYKNVYEFRRFYETITELFEEYFNEFKLGGKINDSPFKTNNPNIVVMSKDLIEELLAYFVDLNTEFKKKDKMQTKNFINFYNHMDNNINELQLQGMSDEEIKEKMLFLNNGIVKLRNIISDKYVKVNETGRLVYSLAKRLRQVNKMRAGNETIMNIIGLMDSLSLYSLSSPKKTENVFVHINEIKDIVKGLQESSKSASIIKKLISETFGDKLNNVQNPQFS